MYYKKRTIQCLCVTDWIIKGEGFQREKNVIKEKHLKVRSSQNRTVLPRSWSAPQEGLLWDFSRCNFPSDFANNHWEHCASFFFFFFLIHNSLFYPWVFRTNFLHTTALFMLGVLWGKEERGQWPEMKREDSKCADRILQKSRIQKTMF